MKRQVSRRNFIKTAATAGIMLSSGTGFWEDGRNALAKEAQAVNPSHSSAANVNVLQSLLQKRRSVREFRPEPLPMPVISRLLWSAFGINRPDGKRTAPSARNRQEIDIYVATSNGLSVYDAKENTVKLILPQDIREITGTQSYAGQAPLNLVYVADSARMGATTKEETIFYSAANTGFICQNVYLFCAAEGLGTTVRAAIDKPLLAQTMKLRPDQIITLAQSVGYPKTGV